MTALIKSRVLAMLAGSKLARRYYGWSLLSIVAAAVVVIGIFVVYTLVQHNFHVVSPGQVYRSAQLNVGQLTRTIQQHGIKSILNLRGAKPDGWYNAEINASQELGVRHFDFTLLAGREVKDEEMEQILAIIESAPKPMLIHCKSGADRTGLVGALYLYSVEGKSARTADRELGMFCGHVPYLFWRDTIAMDRSFWRYVGNHAQAPVGGVKFNHPLVNQD